MPSAQQLTGIKTATKAAKAPTQVDPAAEAAKLAEVVPSALATKLAQIPEADRDMVKSASYTLRAISSQEAGLKAAKAAATKTWLDTMDNIEKRFGVSAFPILDPITMAPKYGVRQQDSTLRVEPMDLREFLNEYFTQVKKEDKELAMTHVLDIMGQVLKPETIDNDKFRALAEAGTIPAEIVAACSRYTLKAAWVRFENPKIAEGEPRAND